MAGTSNVAVKDLKRELEQLFPGKWLTGGDAGRALRTGITELDTGVAFARRRIGEWTGASSSGKSTLLRAVIAQWCLKGLNVAYVDTYSRLAAADWAYVRMGHSGAVPLNMKRERTSFTTMVAGAGSFPDKNFNNAGSSGAPHPDNGNFFVVRVSEVVERRKKDINEKSESNTFDLERDIRQQACWVAEQLIRANVFDVVVFDLSDSLALSDRVYARFKRALERSNTAMIVLKDNDLSEQISTSWGRHAWSGFKWSAPVYCEKSVNGGVSMILPTIEGFVSRDGQTQKMEGRLVSHVQNRLFTHPQVPDRRTSKARA